MEQLTLDIASEFEPTFENFVVGGNAEALACLRALAHGDAFEPIVYVWGSAASGRTHLLRACAAGPAGVYRGAADPLPEDPPRLLALDDVDRLDEAAQVRAFALVNRARERGRTVIAAGGAPPAQLTLRDDLRSRLGWGLVYEIAPLTDRDKREYLDGEARRRGLRLADAVTDYLLTRFPRDLPSLASVLERLDRYSLVHQRPITLPLVRAALGRSAETGRETR